MSKIGLFYGSTTGNTETVAKSIQAEFGGDTVTLLDISSCSSKDFLEYDVLILGTSTWGAGDLQDDWDAFDFKGIDLSGKKVALFGLGDQEGYSDTFVDGMGILFKEILACGGTVIGHVSCEFYNHCDSLAIVNGSFVGLPLDNDNQPELTDDRIAEWVKSIQQQI